MDSEAVINTPAPHHEERLDVGAGEIHHERGWSSVESSFSAEPWIAFITGARMPVVTMRMPAAWTRRPGGAATGRVASTANRTTSVHGSPVFLSAP
jgi:hypothetical protein